jgi:hypothetical protein
MAISDLWDKLWTKESAVVSTFDSCKHEYVHTGQQWIPIDKKLFRLIDHQHCVKCGIERFLEIK